MHAAVSEIMGGFLQCGGKLLDHHGFALCFDHDKICFALDIGCQRERTGNIPPERRRFRLCVIEDFCNPLSCRIDFLFRFRIEQIPLLDRSLFCDQLLLTDEQFIFECKHLIGIL